MLLRPDNPLLTKFLGPREADVMRAVWEGRRTVKDVRAFIEEDAAIIDTATVAAHLRHLVHRRCLTRTVPHNGLAYHYQPIAPDERSFVEQQITRILSALHEDYPDELAAVIARWEAT